MKGREEKRQDGEREGRRAKYEEGEWKRKEMKDGRKRKYNRRERKFGKIRLIDT